jgi:hypothetical protein
MHVFVFFVFFVEMPYIPSKYNVIEQGRYLLKRLYGPLREELYWKKKNMGDYPTLHLDIHQSKGTVPKPNVKITNTILLAHPCTTNAF